MNLASSAQLDMIDKLRALGISNFVALPQVRATYTIIRLSANTSIGKLAVVGDQSR
jgi:hypothetical protein